MSTYVYVSFICGIIGITLRGLILALARYPRKSETSVGSDCVVLITSIAFTLWAAYLLYGGAV